MIYKYDERSNLQLGSEHGTHLKPAHIVEKARTYRVSETREAKSNGSYSRTSHLTKRYYSAVNIYIKAIDRIQ